MNNSSNIFKLIILSIIAVCLVVITIMLLTNNFNFGFKKAKLLYDESYVEEIKNININVKSSDVKINPVDSDKVNVKVYDTEDKDISINLKNDTLEIINNKSRVGFFIFGGYSPKVIIEVPKNNKYNLNIHGTSSDVTVKSDMNNVKLEVTSGDISLQDANDVEIKVTSGDIMIGKVSNLLISSTSGDIKLDKATKKVDIETTSGDIEIDELSLTQNSKIKARSGDITVDKVNDIYVEGKAKSGDVDINKNNRHSDIELRIETTSGDIRVEK